MMATEKRMDSFIEMRELATKRKITPEDLLFLTWTRITRLDGQSLTLTDINNGTIEGIIAGGEKSGNQAFNFQLLREHLIVQFDGHYHPDQDYFEVKGIYFPQ
jgi:hypothetical protein